jgi:hypothetical protein
MNPNHRLCGNGYLNYLFNLWGFNTPGSLAVKEGSERRYNEIMREYIHKAHKVSVLIYHIEITFSISTDKNVYIIHLNFVYTLFQILCQPSLGQIAHSLQEMRR